MGIFFISVTTKKHITNVSKLNTPIEKSGLKDNGVIPILENSSRIDPCKR